MQGAIQKVRTLWRGRGGYLKSVRQRTRGEGYFKERTYSHVIFKCCLFEKRLK